MANLVDVFQLVACLPNVPEKEGISGAVSDGLSRLEQAEPGVRSLYASRLAARAKRHKSAVDTLLPRLTRADPVDLSNPDDENDLRDCLHAVYYAAYFVGRFAMVTNLQHDCSDHKKIDDQLRRLRADDEAQRDRVVAFAAKLKDWRRARDIADYIMSEQRLSEFGGRQVLENMSQELTQVFANWGLG